ncbi:MAG: Ankyrin repeats (3 copies) [Lentisphaerae bacterium ADurb.Bin242]|nr:MAG: Ankyrin repeats (3 copies) [Lentisphaerae bacterium ADurb.Bin242]
MKMLRHALITLCLSGGFLLTACAFHNPLKDRQLANALTQKKPSAKAIEEALQSGADPNYMVSNGATPLILAILIDKPEYVRLLLKHGADVNLAGRRGHTPLHVAATLEHADCLDILLKAGAKPDTHGAFGRTPLMEAARTGRLQNVEKLLQAGADINGLDEMKRTPLMHAAEAHKNSLETVKLLVARGADSTLFDEDAKNAMMHAAEQKNTEVALYLMELVPDLNQRPALGLMMMKSAIKGGDAKVVEKLIDQRVPLNRDLSLVLKTTRVLQVHGAYRVLVRNGLLANGRTPLLWAAMENNLEIVKLLIDRGADPLQPDETGNRADDLATSREVIQYIRNQQTIQLRKYEEMEKKP